MHLRSRCRTPARPIPSYGTATSTDALEPFGLGDRWSFVNYDGTYHGASRETVRALLRRRRSLRQPVRRLVVLARRVRGDSRARSSSTRDPVFTQLAHRQGRRVVRRLLPRLRSPVHLRRQHRHAGVRRADRRLHLAQDLAAGGRPSCGAPTRRPRRSLHDGDDLEDRELHRRGRQQGSRVHQVHRPAVAHAAAASSWRSTARSSCCASTAGPPSTRWACRARCGTTATSSRARRPSSAWPSTPTCRSRSGWFSDRTECYLAAGRPALVQDTGWSAHLPTGAGLLGFSTPEEALDGLDRDRPATTPCTRGAPREIAREHFDAARGAAAVPGDRVS